MCLASSRRRPRATSACLVNHRYIPVGPIGVSGYTERECARRSGWPHRWMSWNLRAVPQVSVGTVTVAMILNGLSITGRLIAPRIRHLRHHTRLMVPVWCALYLAQRFQIMPQTLRPPLLRFL